jgi:hypothetical protein
VNPTREPKTRRVDRLDDHTAALLAAETLGRKVARSTVRWWKHQGYVAGGYGWYDPQSFKKYVLELAQRERAQADTPAGEPDLTQADDLGKHAPGGQVRPSDTPGEQ